MKVEPNVAKRRENMHREFDVGRQDGWINKLATIGRSDSGTVISLYSNGNYYIIIEALISKTPPPLALTIVPTKDINMSC